MVKHSTPTKRGAAPPEGGGKQRISAKTREAIKYLATLGCTQEEAAKLTGMNRSALTRALSKPHTREALHQAQAQQIKAIAAKKPLYKALAWERAHYIAQNSKDERTSLKAVELLTREPGAAPSLSVTVNAGGGYEFAPPGARVVDIEHAPLSDDGRALDTQSSDQGHEPPAIAGPDEDVGE